MSSEITNPGMRKMAVVSGRAHPELAEEIAAELGHDLLPTSAYTFANGETYVRFEESVRGADAFVIQSHPAPINEWLMEQIIMIDALKRASARSITVVSPFYPYARQDKKHKGREPISARLIADLYKTAGADRLMCVDLHTSQIQGFFDGPLDHLFAIPVLANYIRGRVENPENVTVVSRIPVVCVLLSIGLPCSAVPLWPSCIRHAILTCRITPSRKPSWATLKGVPAY